jgi:hypothetical protein
MALPDRYANLVDLQQRLATEIAAIRADLCPQPLGLTDKPQFAGIGIGVAPAAQGDLACGIASSNQYFYDQSAGASYWRSADATNVHVIDTAGATIWNEQGADIDQRWEGDTLTYMMFLDASADTENIALLTTAAPNWRSMDRGIYLGDCSIAPTANASGGVFLYSDSSILTVNPGLWVLNNSGPATIQVGINDNKAGGILLYGNGLNQGGYARLYADTGTAEYFSLQALSGVMQIGHDDATDIVLSAAGKTGFGAAPPSANLDVALMSTGVLCIKETTTPTADTNYGKVYTKSDNKLYFQDGDGTEHEIKFV